MCDQCENLSRRNWLKASAAALAAGAVAACQTTEVSDDLPVPYDDHLLEQHPGPPVKIDPRTIKLPPAVPPQASEYGQIIPRKAWTTRPLVLRNPRPMDGVQRITMHHSGDGRLFLNTDFASIAKHLQLVQRAHLQRGMIDIAYHFAVDRAGRLWQLRWLAYEGQHVRLGKDGTRWNAHNVGIVALGDFNLQSPSKPQCDRLFALVRLIQQKYAVRAGNIKMHGELVRTDCPGKHLIPDILVARRERLL